MKSQSLVTLAFCFSFVWLVTVPTSQWWLTWSCRVPVRHSLRKVTFLRQLSTRSAVPRYTYVNLAPPTIITFLLFVEWNNFLSILSSPSLLPLPFGAIESFFRVEHEHQFGEIQLMNVLACGRARCIIMCSNRAPPPTPSSWSFLMAGIF